MHLILSSVKPFGETHDRQTHQTLVDFQDGLGTTPAGTRMSLTFAVEELVLVGHAVAGRNSLIGQDAPSGTIVATRSSYG